MGSAISPDGQHVQAVVFPEQEIGQGFPGEHGSRGQQHLGGADLLGFQLGGQARRRLRDHEFFKALKHFQVAAFAMQNERVVRLHGFRRCGHAQGRSPPDNPDHGQAERIS
jgi:hypothetical protein